LSPSWLRLFQISWFIGFLGAGVVYYITCLISPPPGGKPYERVAFGNEHGTIIEGQSDSGVETPDVEKASVAPSLKAVGM
jgi:NCS1 family nucleobase:cation symporter-1